LLCYLIRFYFKLIVELDFQPFDLLFAGEVFNQAGFDQTSSEMRVL
jgi:hypothetical protein